MAALLVGAGAPAAFAQCAISPGTNQPSVSNSAAINCININGITVTGNVTNTGRLTATGINPPTLTGITINNASVGGAIVNSGHINGRTDILVTNNATLSGGISNSGTISAPKAIFFTRVWQLGTASAGGGISNSGIITDSSAAIIMGNVTRFYGGISNSGMISGPGSGIVLNTTSIFSGGVSNSGTIFSANGPAISISNVTSFSGGISNSSTISAGLTGISSTNIATFSGGIGNSGTISAGGNGILAGGNADACCTAQTVSVTVLTFSGGISNSGTISAAGNGIWAGGDASVPALTSRNTATVTISAFSGGISNSGTISAGGNGIWAGGNANPDVGVNCCGTNNNNASVMISTFAGGISNSGAIAAGTGNGIFVGGNANVVDEFAFLNTASVTISTFAGGISNSGTISAGGSGIWVGGNPGIDNFDAGNTASVTISAFSGGISNAGTISAGGNGIFVGGSVSFPSFESAAIGATNVASVTISTFAGGISNSGTISAGGAGIWVGGNASISAAGGNQSRNTASVTISTFAGGISNSGTISAGGAGILVGGSASGTIPPLQDFASVTIATFAGGISNSGTIVAQTGIVVDHVATFLGAIVNSGTITGTGGTAIDISGANNAITVDQTGGLISGAIRLSTNADQLNISGGTIAGNIVGQGSSDGINFALGSGTFTYGASYGFSTINQVTVNSGTVILDGTNSATNVAVNGGTLEIGDAVSPGALLQVGPLAVNNGGTLAGNGTIDGPLPATVVTINSGGTLAPGTPGGLGTLTIGGTLNFNANSFYAIDIAPGAGNNSKTALTGVVSAANLNGNGTVVVTPQLGHYDTTNQILTTPSSAQLSGKFAGLTVNGDFSGAMMLDYTTNPGDVDLDISGFALLGTPPGANQNEQNVANGINNGILNWPANTPLPQQFATLGSLSGPSLLNALTQLDGEAATGAETSAFQLMTEFLNLMLDPFVNGRGNLGGSSAGGGPALGFAPDQQASLPPDIALAYDEVFKTPAPSHPSPASGGGSGWGFDQRWGAWGTAYGGSNTAQGNAAVGSNTINASTYGVAGGMDYRVSPYTVVGFSLAGGGTGWGLANALGSGYSEALQVGGYGISWFGRAYVSGALAFTNNWFTTNRTALGDQLTANFSGQSYGVRVEGGYRVPVYATVGVTPYAALQAQDFSTPSYSETDKTGGGLGLSYAAMNATDVRTELGARFDDPTLLYGKPLILFGRLAWAHDFVSNPALSAAFEALPGSSFTVNGAPIPQNSALTTAGAQYFLAANWSVIAKFDGEFANGSQTYAGSGTLRYTW